jgi:transcription elongation factor Elf1
MSLLMPSAAPPLTHAFACPFCTQALSLEYRPATDHLPVTTHFDCPGCGKSCQIDLPGPLRKVRQRN